MKKTILIILSIVLILTSIALFTGCDKEKPNDNGTPSNSSSANLPSTNSSKADKPSTDDVTSSSINNDESVDVPCTHTGGTASCTLLAKCTLCGEPYGELAPHQWNEATCNAPKSCENCDATQGEALGHSWQGATCEEPDSCTVCGATQGEALGHSWQGATCEEPDSCTVCGATQGEALGHTYEESWTVYENEHVKACIFHPDVIISDEHNDENKDGYCDECNYIVKEATTFTVTIKDGDVPVEGVVVLFYSSDNEITSTTNDSGVASADFIYYDIVKLRVVGLPEGFVYNASEDLTFEGANLEIEVNEVVYFEIYVLDKNENGIEGATVNTMYPFTNKATDENGLARFEMLKKELEGKTQLMYISYLPNGYELYDTEFNSLIRIANNSTYKAHADLSISYTVSAQASDGEPLKNAVFTFTKNGESIIEAITNENGIATVYLLADEYNVTISHPSSFFSCDTSNVILNESNNSYMATFTESDGYEPIWFNLVYPDGSLPTYENVQIYTFFPDNFNDCSLLAINDKGQACTNEHNRDFYIYALDKDLNYAFGKYNKNDPTNIYLVMNEGVPAGSSEESAILAQVLGDLPFVPQDFYYSFEKQFVKGEYLYVKVLNALEKTVTINGNLFSLEYNGQEIVPNDDGVISLTFTDIPFGQDAVIKITAKEDATEDLNVTCIGSEENNIYIYSNKPNDLTQTITLLGIGHEIYFAFANMDNTQYKLTVTSEGSDVVIEYVKGQIVNNFGYAHVKITAKEEGTVTLTFTKEPYVQ